MGKKVDLNAPRETNINVKQHHNIHQNVANNNPTDLENDGQSSGIDNIKNLGSLGKQKVIEEGLKSAGVPASIANWASKNQRVQNAANIHMPKGIIKFAMTITMTMSIVLIMAAPIIFLMVFVVLFGGSDSESSSSGAGSGTFTYGQTCEMITVYNTGCDGNAQNCSNAYDGTVDLETYVAGVINAEIGPAPNDLEYYKVVAIAARSYVLNHISSSCRVPGNSTFQGYMTYGGDGIIKQAAEETKGLVLVKDEQIIDAEYSSACVVNADETDYWIRYGSKTLGNPKIQKVPKEWDSNESAFKGFLARWYSMINKSDTNYETKPCPNNHDNGMSQLGALYLTTKENNKGLLYALITAVVFTTLEPVSKLIAGDVNPYTITLWRFLIGSVMLLPFAIRKIKKEYDNQEMRVISTGGLGKIIANQTDLIDIYDPDLTFKGLKIIYDKNKNK